MKLQLNTLVELLALRARTQPNHTAFTFLPEGDLIEETMTYQSLHENACIIAGYLQTQFQIGDRALLIFPSGLEFIKAFFGCLYAGLIAVPVQTPRATRGFQQLEAIIENANPSVVLTERALEEFVKINLPALTVLATNTLDPHYIDRWHMPVINQQSLAFLQYTSGSTGSPKGVMVSHGNVLHNQAIMKHAFKHDERSIIVGWLPFYHDMGLIGNMLQPIYLGRPCIFMQPMSFIQTPFLWLKAISRFRATTSGGPSFAYELCLRKVTAEQLQTLDLSCWSTAFNGAEPVRAEVINQFADHFASAGFNKTAFFPCYGMAEATLFITGSNSHNRPVIQHVEQTSLAENALQFCSADTAKNIAIVGCGQSSVDQTVAIVSPKTFTRCPEDMVGEIWVSGPSVAQGYWNNSTATMDAFGARIHGDNERVYLRTGDLGFFHDNELFIAGRLKDLIIIRGSNYYPQDIEKIVEQSHPALRPTCCSAFSIEIMGEEKLVIVQEIEREHIRKLDDKAILSAIRQAVADSFNLNIYAIALLKTGQVPKTSSGKVKRRACKEKYLSESFQIIKLENTNENLITTEVSKQGHTKLDVLVEIAAQILKIEKTSIDIHCPLIHYGIDSIMAVEFQSLIETNLNILWPVNRFLQGESLTQLAEAALNEADPTLLRKNQHAQCNSKTESPLSYTQEAMYFLYQLIPDSAVYNVYFSVRIKQPINLKAWEDVWHQLFSRHAVLRTTYHTENGRALQKVHPEVKNPLQWISHSNLDEKDLQAILAEETRRPFVLENEPPFRLQLHSINQSETVFLFVAHHIACDLTAIIILMREFGEHYQRFVSSGPVGSQSDSYRYIDYIQQQRDDQHAFQMQKDLEYWQQKLSGELPVLNLPTDQRPPIQTLNGAEITFNLNADLTNQLKQLAKNHNMTLYMVLMASFQLLLHRYTQQDDILVGSAVAGRHQAETQQLIGCFINTIVLRATFTPDLSCTDFLIQVRQTILEAFDHQHYPFHKLVADLQIKRESSRSSLFQAMFVLQNTRLLEDAVPFLFGQQDASLTLGGLSLEAVRLEKHATLYDLTLLMAVTEEGLLGSFEYNSDLFSADSIEKLIAHFKLLLEGMVQDPKQNIQAIAILTKVEKHKLLTTFNNTAVEFAADSDFLGTFMRKVQQHPQLVAVQFDDEHLSYQELDRRSNQVANYLLSFGVGANVIVGVLLDRSFEMLIALLGILKAGGAYLPLDPHFPLERLDYMIKDAQLSLLITQQNLMHLIQDEAVRKFDLTEQAAVINQQSFYPPQQSVMPEHLAYVIYTSGSTGKPKGVLIKHHSLNNFLNAMHTSIRLDVDDKCLAVTTISFDIAVLELFLPLISGATVVIASSKTVYNVDALIDQIQNDNITCMQATPTTWQMLLAAGWQAYPGFKVFIGGETLPPVVAQKLLENACSVWNLYGPTENTVWTTLYKISTIPQDKFGYLRSIPIGKPIANVKTYILDRHLHLASIGVVGELYISGAGLAAGYLNQPELTQSKFIHHAVQQEVIERLYATGDAARYLADGQIEFLGRMDNQVKLRGYRIELEEIENALLQHPSVESCAVILHSGQGSEHAFLAAYLVTSQPLTSTDLQEYLRLSLPTYMVPSLYEFLAELPQTNNNKINRKALLDLKLTRDLQTKDFVSPATEAEKILATIWCDCLNLTKVSIHDNFFDLGGHSLLVMRVSNSLIEQHSMHLPLQIFFENQTIAKLAIVLEKYRQERSEQFVSILDKVKNLSPEEVKQLLQAKRAKTHAHDPENAL